MLDYFTRKRKSVSDKAKARTGGDGTKSAEPKAEASTSSKATAISDSASPRKDPVLDHEDEAFLERMISLEEGHPPALPERSHDAAVVPSRDAQVVLMQGADTTPLPDAPDTPEGEVATSIEGAAIRMAEKDKAEAEERERKRRNRFSWLRRSSSRTVKKLERKETGDSIHEAAQKLKTPAKDTETSEAAKEEDEIAGVLEQLNLAAENNKVFSVSEESQDLLKKFTLVLKDLVNGVPTAYHDLESLLTNSDQQIQKTYKSLPPFLQELIEKLPEKITGKLGAEMIGSAAAAAVEEEEHERHKKNKRSSHHAHESEHADESDAGTSKSRKSKIEYLASGAATASKLLKVRVPSLKELLAKQGSVVALLRSIIAFLRARFPAAIMGMNVLWSVALFVLLFIFWYCHKRGRETRLEQERKLTDEETEAIRARVAADPAWTPPPGWVATDSSSRGQSSAEAVLTTRAPVGASVEEVAAGIGPSQHGDTADENENDTTYAPDGSLAKAIENKDVKADGDKGSASK